MKLSDIKKSGFTPRKIIGNVLFSTDQWNGVYKCHRFAGKNREHWTYPIFIGNARKGFSEYCNKGKSGLQ